MLKSELLDMSKQASATTLVERLRAKIEAHSARVSVGLRLSTLMYHHVGPRRPGTLPQLTIGPGQFEQQVRWLAKRGYRGIAARDWLAWCKEGKRLPEKPILLTFDDAYADLAEYAFPILEHYGFGAAVFVVTGLLGGTNAWDEANTIGTHRLLTANQICDWHRRGIEFGAHGRTHVDLTTEGLDLGSEIVGSGDDLAALLHGEVTAFAYPYGATSPPVREVVTRRFQLAFGTEPGMNNIQTDPYALKRSMVKPHESILEFGFRVRVGRNLVGRVWAGVARRLYSPEPELPYLSGSRGQHGTAVLNRE